MIPAPSLKSFTHFRRMVNAPNASKWYALLMRKHRFFISQLLRRAWAPLILSVLVSIPDKAFAQFAKVVVVVSDCPNQTVTVDTDGYFNTLPKWDCVTPRYAVNAPVIDLQDSGIIPITLGGSTEKVEAFRVTLEHIGYWNYSYCYQLYLNGQFTTDGVWQYPSSNPQTYSFEVRPALPPLDWDIPKQNGRRSLTADGQSRAVPSYPGKNIGQYYWSVYPSDLATIDVNRGIVTAGKREGTIIVKAIASGDVCITDQIDLVKGCEDGTPCDSLPCLQSGSIAPSMGSVDIKMPLGWSKIGGSARFLQIAADYPSTNLAKPIMLQYSFLRSDVETNCDANGLRQVKAPDCLANVVVTNSQKYFVYFYAPSNVLAKSGGVYGVANSPFATTSVEFVGGDTNWLRVVNVRDGATSTADYYWITNGWKLITGNGLRVETVPLTS